MRVNIEQDDLNTLNEVWKAPGFYEAPTAILDDLSLNTESEDGIKAGCPGCDWGPPVTNHNETTVGDADTDVALIDLKLSDEMLDTVNGGHGVTVLAYARVNDVSPLR